MPAILQELVTLLTRPPGNLIYHLVLAFSTAAALPAALNLWRHSGYPQGRRMVIGLAPILLLLLALFFVGGISWQGLLAERSILPPLDRAIALLSLLLIVWLWAFPEPQRLADSACLLLFLLTFTLAILNLAWWASQLNPATYNGSVLDLSAQVYALVIAFAGLLLLLIRRPPGWSFGFAMIFLLALGHLAQLLFPDRQGDFPGLLRIAQLAAFPLLLSLPQRFPLSVAPTSVPAAPGLLATTTPVPTHTDPRLVDALLSLAASASKPDLCQQVTRLTSMIMLSDFTMLAASPDDDWQISILCCYDLIREELRDGANLNGNQAPAIAAALRHAHPLRIPDSNTSPDLLELAHAMHLERAGHLLCAPIASPTGGASMGLILLSPYSNRPWSLDDQTRLLSLSKSLAHVLLRAHEQHAQVTEMETLTQSLQAAHSNLLIVQQENQSLLEQRQNPALAGSGIAPGSTQFAALLSDQEQAQQTISQLTQEIEHLHQQLQALPSIPAARAHQENVQAELRLALEEIASLRSELASPVSQPAPLLADQRLENLNALVQDLRQPMAAITGYTEFLLGESVGILGALQRKFLERIKIASDRMTTLLDDILQQPYHESATLQLSLQLAELNKIIDQAIFNTSEPLQQKNIALRVDMPDELPQLETDPQALEQVITNLLENAGKVTPDQGEISLRLEVKGETGEPGFILIQVADQGGGIGPQDIPRIFSRLYTTPVSGAGDSGAGLSIIKTLVEALHGRIWVDTEPGVGAVFSILMPVSAAANGDEIA